MMTWCCRSSCSSWILTNWFGNSAPSALSNSARNLTVPVVDIDLIVERQQLAFGKFRAVGAVERFDFQASAVVQLPIERGNIIFRESGKSRVIGWT